MAHDNDNSPKRSPYAKDRGLPGAYEGETVTRRRLFEGGALAAGGIATAAFGLPALGFAVGPMFEKTTHSGFSDVGPVADFNADTFVPKVMTILNNVGGEIGKTTVYVRQYNPSRDSPRDSDLPYVALTTRCAHLGCPVRYYPVAERFICPCHGGVYDFQGKVVTGPPVRPLDRFATKVENGRVLVGDRFSVNSQLERFPPRDPSNHLDGLWKFVYPPRPTV
jgi:menaquinol-cytochrome c reductase iron-sulfur subunit